MPLIHEGPGHYRADGIVTSDEILNLAASLTTEAKVGHDVIADPEAAKRLFIARLRHLEHEEFHIAFLDTRHRLIAVEAMFRGTIDGAEVHPREVVKAAMRHNAAAVLCAHNHPSQDAQPSAADRAVTSRLKQALALIDVRLLDHLVVGNPEVISLASRGWV